MTEFLKHNKRLPNISEYISMLLPMDGSLDNETVNQHGAVTSGCEEEFYAVQTSEKGWRMMPGPEFSPRLYRGQSQRYNTCKSSLFRDNFKYADAIYWTVKRIELGFLLANHPAIKDIMSWDFDGLKFDLNLQAIAQHYHYPTQMLDLTRSKDVAMFFATHEFLEHTQNVKPAIGNTAILYTVDVAHILKEHSNTFNFVPIGLDPLPRPAAQRAFGLELAGGENFEVLPGVYIETFTVTELLATYYANKVGGVSALFPPDPFENYIANLRDNKTITKRAIDMAIIAGLFPAEYSNKNIENLLISEGYQLSDKDIQYPHEKIIQKSAQEWECRRSAYIERIKFRFVADGL